MGFRLGELYPTEGDIVFGVPESGVFAAAGFAEASRIEYEQTAMIRDFHAMGRSFISPGFVSRRAVLNSKHSLGRRLIEGRRVVVVDDSIVRGTTSEDIIERIYKAGATEVHMRIAAPPIRHSCFYGIDTPDPKKLIARNRSEEEIAKKIGATTLRYLPLEETLRILNSFEQGWCMGCITGDYPIPLP